MSEKRKDNKGRVLKDGESQRKDGRYMYRYNDIHGNRKYVYAPTLKELREKEQQIRRDLEDGIDTAAGEMTLGELLDLYLTLKKGLRDSTIVNYKAKNNVLKKYRICSLKISQIKKIDVIAFVTELSNNGYAYASIESFLGHFKCAFSLAIANDFIRKNPCEIDLKDIIPNETQERAPISQSDYNSLLEFMNGHNCYKKYVDMMIILACTGLRVSELCALTISDIDFENKLIHITKQILYINRKGLKFGPPKTSKGVRIILIEHDELYNALTRAVQKAKNRKVQCTFEGSSPMLFCTIQHHPYNATLIDDQFQRIITDYKKIHPEFSTRVTPHTLRHTFCSNLINNDANIKSVQYLMGHSKSNVTLDIYTHVDAENVRETIKKLNHTKTDTKIDTKPETTSGNI